jgi:hypothetical protein
MSLKPIMLDQLAITRRIVTDGHENIPAWRIETPDGAWMILTRFDPDKPGQRQRATHLVKRFMAWKFAHAFVQTAETWLGHPRSGVEAVIGVAVSKSERLAVLQVIRPRRQGRVGPFQGSNHQVVPSISRSCPASGSHGEEAAALALMFAEGGEPPAQAELIHGSGRMLSAWRTGRSRRRSAFGAPFPLALCSPRGQGTCDFPLQNLCLLG